LFLYFTLRTSISQSTTNELIDSNFQPFLFANTTTTPRGTKLLNFVKSTNLVGFLMILLWAGCSVEPTQGGGGFEGETLALHGTATHAGRNLSGASVTFQDLGTNANLGRTTTDAGGNFSLRLPKGSKGFLEITSGDSALSRTLVENAPTAPISVTTETPSRWKARLTNSGNPVAGATLRILGSSDSVKSAADGRFDLLRSASRREWIAIRFADGTQREILLPALVDSLLALPDHDSVLLDDFENPDNRSRLGSAVGSGWWFVNDDSLSQGTSKAFPAGITKNIRPAYSDSDAYEKTSLAIRFEVDQSHIIHYCQLGLLLSDSGAYMDLSGLDSISFMAKGTGFVRLLFGTRLSMEPTLDPLGMTGVNLTIPDTWTRMVVRRSDILPASGSRSANQGIPWSIESKTVRTMVFFFDMSASLQLDDIVFHGPKLTDLRPKP
jgi:hypothetical protein